MFKELISKLDGPQKFRLIDELHLLELYGGYDSNGRKCILLITEIEVSKLKNTQYIDVNIDTNEKKYVFFSLKDEQFTEQFYLFADDLIEYSRLATLENMCARKYIQRYLMWRTLFGAEINDLMSFEKIKGLFAELMFFKDHMISEYGIFGSVNSWLGPNNAKRDFEVSNYWYEIKATTSDSNEVKISSISQLDDTITGELVVIKLEKTNFENLHALSLYSLVEEIINLIQDFNLQDIFISKLNEYGYRHNDKYKNSKFHFKGIKRIEINEYSNILRTDNLPKSIGNLTYNINYNLINKGENNESK